MNKIEIKINPTKETSYPIYIGEGILNNLYELIEKHTNANKYLVVTNDTVYSMYGEYLKSEKSEFIILPDGEIYKNTDMLNRILDKALEINLERKDCIIALGGGVIGDMAGFAAAVCRRGINYVQIPTTLLAQVDSSVGGKVAVNHMHGKNLIGAFYQPKAVIADISTLKTLDERQYKTGLSEVIKYAFIEKSCGCEKDFNFLEFLSSNIELIKNRDFEVLKELIKICCTLKGAVVNKDEKEKGLRAILNFGHTYAHAIENLTGYEKYTHGEAVSVGMRLIFNLAYKLETIGEDYYYSALNLLKDYDLVTTIVDEFDKEEFYNVMLGDKKVSDGKINFVIPTDEKKVEIRNNIVKNVVLEGI